MTYLQLCHTLPLKLSYYKHKDPCTSSQALPTNF